MSYGRIANTLFLGAIMTLNACTTGSSPLVNAPRTGAFSEGPNGRLYFDCRGWGTPTVVLEAGAGSHSLEWAWVLAELETRTKVCAYDRRGLGQSAGSTVAPNAAEVVTDLHDILERERVPGPYVLVGHSLGGAYARAYCARYPDSVVGMVLVDPSPSDPDSLERLGVSWFAAEAMRMALRQAPFIAHFGIHAMANGMKEAASGLPADVLEEGARLWRNPSRLAPVRDELLEMPRLLSEVGAPPLGDIPLVVLGSDEPPPGQSMNMDVWRGYHEATTATSSRGEYRTVPGSNHLSIVTERRHAMAIVQAVDDVLERSRISPKTGESPS